MEPYPLWQMRKRAGRARSPYWGLSASPCGFSRVSVYIIRCCDGHARKLGQAVNVDKRLRSLRGGNPHDLTLEHSVELPGEMATAVERALHSEFAEQRLRHEWFAVEAKVAAAALDKWAARAAQCYDQLGADAAANHHAEWYAERQAKRVAARAQ